jgi:hypothetical protein
MADVPTRVRIPHLFVLALGLCVASSANGKHSSKKELIRLIPRYSTGQVLRYSVQLRMKTTARATGPIVDPEGATQFNQSVSVILLLDVISGGGTATGPVRLQATYEKVAASGKSDSYDPNARALGQQYQKLQGRSIEFTLRPDGKITDITGLEDVATDPSRAAEMNQWLSQITLGASTPRKGMTIGEKWSSEQPLVGAPLDGVVWHTSSTYQSNEPCALSEMNSGSDSGRVRPQGASPVPEECAIILTRSETRDSRREGDRTPRVYKQNGLRTSGEWKGTGVTLTVISPRSGMVVSVTQNVTTHMDFTVTAGATGNRIHYTGDTQSQAQITLLSESRIP